MKYINLMNKCSLVLNKTSNYNMSVIIDHLSKVTLPLFHEGKIYCVYLLQLLRKHWMIVVLYVLSCLHILLTPVAILCVL